MSKTKPGMTRWPAAFLLTLPLAGCFTLRSEHEVKPIHITMDVHLKVDRELDRYFGAPDAEALP